MAEINVIDRDDSIATLPSTNNIDNSIGALAPIFSSKGIDNKIVRISSATQLDNEFGDLSNLELYGQQGIQIRQALLNGSVAYVCRLMPDDSKYASSIISVGCKETDGLIVYKRNEYGQLITDDDGNYIPETDDNDEVITTSGVTFKWIQKQVVDFDEISNNSLPFIEGGYEYYPMFFMRHNARGECGNLMKFGISRGRTDSSRDRWRTYGFIAMIEDSIAGNIPSMSNVGGGNSPIEFSFDPLSTYTEGSSVSLGFNTIWKNRYSMTAGTLVESKLVVELFSNNYNSMVKKYIEPNSSGDPEDVDFVFCLDRNGVQYDEFVLDPNSIDFYNTEAVALIGGDDGSFKIGNNVTTETGTIIVTDEIFENTKESLLIRFFNFNIDSDLRDIFLCDPRILFDANYSLNVKRSMAKFNDIRKEVFVVYDCGKTKNYNDAIAMSKTISGFINGAEGYRYCLLGQYGTTTNLSTPIKVTATYDFSSLLFKVYSSNPFVSLAGINKRKGQVNTVFYDWYPTASENDFVLKQLDLNKVVCARQMIEPMRNELVDVSNTTGVDAFYQSIKSMYVKNLSKLNEYNNGLIMCDVRALAKKILAKFWFTTADFAIESIINELTNAFAIRYNKDLTFDFDVFQTEADKILNQISCNINVIFPNMVETFNVTISARRPQ